MWHRDGKWFVSCHFEASALRRVEICECEISKYTRTFDTLRFYFLSTYSYPQQLTKEKTRNGKGWILGDPVKKLVYYAVKGDTDIPPVSNWKSHLGKKPVPLTKAIHSRRSLEEKRMKDAMKKANAITSTESNVGFLGKPLTKAQEQRRMVYVQFKPTLSLLFFCTHTYNETP